MHQNTFMNALFLCLVNISFMVAGVIFNSVVIVSLLKSSQLRNKLCYFMILVLSCFDLVVVTVIHPVLILGTISWSMQTLNGGFKIAWVYITTFLEGFSMFALLTLNVERFLGVTFPIFHRTSVTKKRLVFFMAFCMIVLVVLSPLFYFYGKTFGNITITVFFILLLFVFICLNYKIFTIVRSKHMDQRVSPMAFKREETCKAKLNFKNISSCSLAVACFFICSLPQVIYSTRRYASETTAWNDTQIILFSIWSNTILAMNSTFNCLIFFWRNSILRREGVKLAKRFRSEHLS